MEFTKLNKFLNNTLNLLSIDCFSFNIGTIQHVIGEDEMINYKELHKEVIEEVYKNISIIQSQSVAIYFHEILKIFEKYETKKEWEYRPHLPSKIDHYYWEFREVLVRENQENEELMEIYNFGFSKYIIQENSKKRLVIIERLKEEIVEIKDDYFNNEKEQLPERIQSGLSLSLRVTDFTVLNKFSGYIIQLFRNEYDYENKTKDEITASIYERYKNLELNVNSLFKFSKALQEERINFALSIPGKDQREYFLNFYNGIINQRVKDIEEHIWEIIEFILGDTYQKNPNATVTRESLEKECEWANFLLSAFSKDYSTKENIETDNQPLPETNQSNSKNSLSHKQQILLLEKLGVFEIPGIKNLTGIQIGKLFSYLLNRDEKNTNTYFRNKSLDKKQVSMDKDFVKTDTNVKRVSEILKEIGLEK